MTPAEIRRVLEGIRMIITHINPDIDACISAFKFWRACGRPKGMSFGFVQPGEGGDSRLDEGVVVVDTGGGRFDHHQKNSSYPCAALAVHEFLRPIYSEDELWAYKVFCSAAEYQDLGKTRELYAKEKYKASIAEATGLVALHQSILYRPAEEKEDIKKRSLETLEKMFWVLDLLYERKLGQAEVKKKVKDKERWVSPDGAVVLLKDADPRYTKYEENKFFRKFVVYSSRTACGVVRTRHATYLDLLGFVESSYFKKLFGGNSKEKDLWFVHNDGHVLSYTVYGFAGSRRPSSRVDPLELTKSVWEWMSDVETET